MNFKKDYRPLTPIHILQIQSRIGWRLRQSHPSLPSLRGGGGFILTHRRWGPTVAKINHDLYEFGPLLSPLSYEAGANFILFFFILKYSRLNFSNLGSTVPSWRRKQLKNPNRICQSISATCAKTTKSFSREEKRVAIELWRSKGLCSPRSSGTRSICQPNPSQRRKKG